MRAWPPDVVCRGNLPASSLISVTLVSVQPAHVNVHAIFRPRTHGL